MRCLNIYFSTLAFLTACSSAEAPNSSSSESSETAGSTALGASAGGSSGASSIGGGGQASPPDGSAAGTTMIPSGGAGNGGTAAAGGSAGSASMGALRDGGTKCARGLSSALPVGAPKLTVGTWVNISPAGVPFDANATAFAQGITLDPCNYGTLYFSVEGNDQAKAKAGLYKSTDAGSTWKKIGPLDEPINVRVDPRNPQHLYASDGVRGSTMGFWVSNDGGDTWKIPDGFNTAARANGACCDVYHVDTDPSDFDHVLVSFHSPWSNDNGAGGILETFDGGNAWTAHKPPSGWAGGAGYGVFFLYEPDLGIGDNKTWLVGCQNGKGHWRTTDAGNTWSQVTSNSMEHGGNQIYYTHAGVLYAGGFPKVMRSMDNGATWKTVGPDINPPGYLSVMGDGTHIYAGLHNGPASKIETSLESDGVTWANYNDQTFFEGPFEMAFDPINGILYSSMIRAGAWALKVR